jgi:hypothetical protein
MILNFKAIIQIRGINPYVSIGREQAQALKPGWKKPMPVLIQINGKPRPAWPINLMPKGNGEFFLYLHNDVREASGTGVGDFVQVKLRFNSKYKGGPTEPMPSWFESQLKKNKKALTKWQSLNASHQKEIIRYLCRLKTPAAQKRNLENVMKFLQGLEKKFMGRAL